MLIYPKDNYIGFHKLKLRYITISLKLYFFCNITHSSNIRSNTVIVMKVTSKTIAQYLDFRQNLFGRFMRFMMLKDSPV